MLGPGGLASREPGTVGTPLAKIRAGWLDVACVAILALSCVLLRAGTLRHATLNPEASAAAQGTVAKDTFDPLRENRGG